MFTPIDDRHEMSCHMLGGSTMPQTSRTDPTLLRALEKAAKQRLTPEELRSQRVSYILSSLARESLITREQVERVLANQEGRTA
jgi:hypothetical protein